ncbi:SPX domain-containing protein 1-like [Macadamia integrifolia]|uniref:SPX domain-containing protein 1-like n=1 Tax=Macadamia integrifolia TaxID=60698 RepID=UPI001C4FA495|nr:SPX domain-containing protein 1-like [Macadamia integrifolia]
MKFGKSLSNQIEETLPEWRDKFLSYKDLKKKLKLIDPKTEERRCKRPRLVERDGFEAGEMEMSWMTREEKEFIRLLEDELEKFNAFFVEKEEEYIIRLKELQDRVAKARDSNEEMIKVRKEIVDFHGEMVLLENYSALNYTGLVKILKKYDKRTGALIRLPFIQRVLQQPFFTTDLLYKLVKECETMLDSLFPKKELFVPEGDGNEGCDTKPVTTKDGQLIRPKELAEIEYMESLYMKSSISALRVLEQIRSKSSTVSVFSLPPLQGNGLEETWNKVPVLEQVAK